MATVVRGARELIRAFETIDVTLKPVLNEALKKAAEPIAADARQRISAYEGASLSTIKPLASLTGGVRVRQSQRKRTGQHPQFGALQMEHLLAARSAHTEEVVTAAEAALDLLARKVGF